MRADHGQHQRENAEQVALALTLVVGDVFFDADSQQRFEGAGADRSDLCAVLAEDGELFGVTTIDADLSAVLADVGISGQGA